MRLPLLQFKLFLRFDQKWPVLPVELVRQIYQKYIPLQDETELSYRLTPSLTRTHTKPRTKQLRDEVISVKKDISLKDSSVHSSVHTEYEHCK